MINLEKFFDDVGFRIYKYLRDKGQSHEQVAGVMRFLLIMSVFLPTVMFIGLVAYVCDGACK